jgi:hypothetical protein
VHAPPWQPGHVESPGSACRDRNQRRSPRRPAARPASLRWKTGQPAPSDIGAAGCYRDSIFFLWRLSGRPGRTKTQFKQKDTGRNVAAATKFLKG